MGMNGGVVYDLRQRTKEEYHVLDGEVVLDVIHFFEVKFSHKHDPLWRITPSKLAKIIKTIGYYFLRYPSSHDYQIDAILVTQEKIEIIKNISY